MSGSTEIIDSKTAEQEYGVIAQSALELLMEHLIELRGPGSHGCNAQNLLDSLRAAHVARLTP